MTASNFDASPHELRGNWGWLLGVGIVLILLGAFALLKALAVPVFSMLVFGWLLLFAGIAQGIQTFRHRSSGHFLLHLLNAIFSFIVGIILLRNSLTGFLVVTALLTAYFIVVGIFRIVAALTVRVPGAGWTLANGIITLILGILVWARWPVAALWILGVFIGINLITTGCSHVMLAFTSRRHCLKAA